MYAFNFLVSAAKKSGGVFIYLICEVMIFKNFLNRRSKIREMLLWAENTFYEVV
jgi:hypothetical protein